MTNILFGRRINYTVVVLLNVDEYDDEYDDEFDDEYEYDDEFDEENND